LLLVHDASMPRDGALILSDLEGPTLAVCAPCGPRGRYNVAGLIERQGNAKLPDLLGELASLSAIFGRGSPSARS
jgi:hypothetical protein